MRILIGIQFFVSSIVFCLAVKANTEKSFFRNFGDRKNPAVIFLHGGPDSDSSLFEASAAEALSKRGYFVVTYDQPGQGRRGHDPVHVNFDLYLNDLKEIIAKLDLKKPALLGHSFGGIVAIKFKERYPNEVSKVVLVSTPLEIPQVFSDIATNCLAVAKRDPQILKVSESIQKDLKGLRSKGTSRFIAQGIHHIFRLAFECGPNGGLYMPHPGAPGGTKIYDVAATRAQRTDPGSFKALEDFVDTEKFQEITVTALVQKNPEAYFGIYGEQDGLFTAETLSHLKKTMPNLKVISGAGHNVFADQEQSFLQQLLIDLR